MELTISETLQRAIAAHKAGKLQDAERLYRLILNSQPSHADANHNLGVLAVSVNKIDLALPFLESALKANPKIEQFWLSYIDALIKGKDFSKAKAIIGEGKGHGISEEKLNVLEAQMVPQPGQGAVTAFSPHPEQLEILLNHYQNNRLDDAEKFARSLTDEFPEHPFAWKMLAILKFNKEKIDESIEMNQKALDLNAKDGEVCNNLAASFISAGKFEEAELYCKKAIELNAVFSAAYFNIAQAQARLEKIELSRRNYLRALILDPLYAEVYNNLGDISCNQANYYAATDLLEKAIILKADFKEASWNLSVALIHLQPKCFSRRLADRYFDVLNKPGAVRPRDLERSIFKLLNYNKSFIKALEKQHSLDNVSILTTECTRLSQIPLFLKVLELCPNTNLDIENFLKNIRKQLLLKVLKFNCVDVLKFQISLAMQCFVNEYIIFETDEETLAIEKLEQLISKELSQKIEVSPHLIACLAGYRPLFKYSWIKKIESIAELEELYKKQVLEKETEENLRPVIEKFHQIEDSTSSEVRNQYEANPYPRWVNTMLEIEPVPIKSLIRKLRLKPKFDIEHLSSEPEILVAGCGTGQHPLATATKFKNSHITAIDLSLSSLSYAMRKAEEYDIKNIKFLHGDILNLSRMEKQFDVVESVGVLHHMSNPLRGLEILVSLLKEGGVFKLGLYGEFGRKHVVAARNLIREMDIDPSVSGMRSFREHIKTSTDPVLYSLTTEFDFYAMSNFRDLVFHTEEHRFTGPELSDVLESSNLHFLDFEYPSEEERKRSEKHYYANGKIELSRNLDFPRYSFWCQKTSTSNQVSTVG